MDTFSRIGRWGISPDIHEVQQADKPGIQWRFRMETHWMLPGKAVWLDFYWALSVSHFDCSPCPGALVIHFPVNGISPVRQAVRCRHRNERKNFINHNRGHAKALETNTGISRLRGSNPSWGHPIPDRQCLCASSLRAIYRKDLRHAFPQPGESHVGGDQPANQGPGLLPVVWGYVGQAIRNACTVHGKGGIGKAAIASSGTVRSGNAGFDEAGDW